VVQKAVRELREIAAKLDDDLDAERLAAAERCIDALVHPLGPDDIRALMSLLPEAGDTAFGLNWTILHAIEAAPDWPLWDMLEDSQSEWVRRFRSRLANAGFHPPAESDATA
jgi:hypothetical protein